MARRRILVADDRARLREAFVASLEPAFAELIQLAVRHGVVAS